MIKLVIMNVNKKFNVICVKKPILAHLPMIIAFLASYHEIRDGIQSMISSVV